jgi:nitrate/TMAO reductase-like tetraheme cytochrome c subunit
MGLRDTLTGIARPAFYLANNAISLVGVVATTASGVSLVVFWTLELVRGGAASHPYGGVLLFLILPAAFVAGLVLIPAGIVLRRQRLRRAGVLPASYPRIDLGDARLRTTLTFVTLATGANVAIVGVASYKGMEHLDSVQFCGQTCHSVMAPEYAAYVNSPHSRVGCVQCHIGPGASWFVKSKLSGTRQVFATMFGTFSRPIPSPVKELRPARETCEQCHWPSKFHGDKLVVKTRFAEDESNTRSFTVLLLRVGGHSGRTRTGIHGRHLDVEDRIHYVTTDERRGTIPQVTWIDDEGKAVEFMAKRAEATELAKGERRSMDCVDCHNRPTHAFETPEGALDVSLATDRVSRELPFVKKKGVELLKAAYADQDAAAREIKAGLERFYRDGYPDLHGAKREAIAAAGAELVTIYRRNVFPSMKLTWGAHPNHIGHPEPSSGCFRCHDDEHRAPDGRTISQECNACHAILAMDEADPKVLGDLGIE